MNGVTPRGWGSYFVNFNPLTNSLTEVPHVLFDTNTEPIGAKVFERRGIARVPDGRR